MTEIEEDDQYLIIYLDGSLTNNNGRRRSGYGVVGYIQGREVFRQGVALGEHAKVYNTKMAGLWAAAEETRRYILDEWTELKPERIISMLITQQLSPRSLKAHMERLSNTQKHLGEQSAQYCATTLRQK